MTLAAWQHIFQSKPPQHLFLQTSCACMNRFLQLLIRSRQVYYLDEALAANIVQLPAGYRFTKALTQIVKLRNYFLL